MDWNGNLGVPIPSRPENSFSFLYNYDFEQFPEMKHPPLQATAQHGLFPALTGKSTAGMNKYYVQDSKKKKLSNEQLESLENSFQEDIKLEPDRKMKLAKELGLQPRQVAVWFQNRRARWKAKQLERWYDELKQEFDAVSRDTQKLRQEVMALRAIMKDPVGKKQGFTEISGEETVESTLIPTSDKPHNIDQNIAECNNAYALNVDDSNNLVMMMPAAPNWAAQLPSYP